MRLWLLTRFFAHADETDEQLDALTVSAFALMSGVLAPLGRTLTRLPAEPGHPGRTAGPTFEMYYQMGNLIPSRGAAWALMSERAAMLAARCADVASHDAAPISIGPVAETAAAVAARLARQRAPSASTHLTRQRYTPGWPGISGASQSSVWTLACSSRAGSLPRPGPGRH